ncbi:hypothetical protein BD413DRAFT_244980, partial [Trametes elegans]
MPSTTQHASHSDDSRAEHPMQVMRPLPMASSHGHCAWGPSKRRVALGPISVPFAALNAATSASYWFAPAKTPNITTQALNAKQARTKPKMTVDVARANATFLASLPKPAQPRLRPLLALANTPAPASSAATTATTKPSTRGSLSSNTSKPHTIEHPFSLAGVSTLDEPIMRAHLPDELHVFDRGNITGRRPRRPESALRYVRVHPRPSKNAAGGAPRRGFLFLD